MSRDWIFVSDWHICDNSKASDFRPASTVAQRFLTRFQNKAIVFGVGDMFELKQTDIYKIFRDNKQLISAMARYRENLWLQPGNHDILMQYLAPVVSWRVPPSRCILHLYGHRILVEHGHEYDRWNKGQGRIGSAVAKVTGWLERLIDPDMDDYMEQVRCMVSDHRLRVDEYDSLTAQAADIHDCDIAIHGHDHEPHETEINGIKILDTGTWVRSFDNAYPFVRVSPDHIGLEFCDA